MDSQVGNPALKPLQQDSFGTAFAGLRIIGCCRPGSILKSTRIQTSVGVSMKRVFLSIAVTALFATCVFGQSEAGSISGTVKDTTGGVMECFRLAGLAR